MAQLIEYLRIKFEEKSREKIIIDQIVIDCDGEPAIRTIEIMGNVVVCLVYEMKGAHIQTSARNSKSEMQTDIYMEQRGTSRIYIRNISTIGGTIA